MTYDAWLVSGDVVESPIDMICSPQVPCENSTILIDTPLWREAPEELSAFQGGLRDLFAVTDDPEVFPQAPNLVFTSLAATEAGTTARLAYEALIFEEADAVGVDVQVDLSE